VLVTRVSLGQGDRAVKPMLWAKEFVSPLAQIRRRTRNDRPWRCSDMRRDVDGAPAPVGAEHSSAFSDRAILDA